jgi:hypothetical protein
MMSSTIGMHNWPFLCFGHGLNGRIQQVVEQLRIWLRSNRLMTMPLKQ